MIKCTQFGMSASRAGEPRLRSVAIGSRHDRMFAEGATHRAKRSRHSAAAQPPRIIPWRLRIVMGAPQQCVIQAVDNGSKLSRSTGGQHDGCLFQARSCPTLTTAGAHELRFPRPPSTLTAVNMRVPYTYRDSHHTRQPNAPLQLTDCGVRGAGQPGYVAITDPWASRDGQAVT
jgi:hypothetical protein